MPRIRSLLLLLPLVACSGPESGESGPDASTPSGDGGGDATQVPEMGIVNVVVSGYPGSGMPPQYFANASVVFYEPNFATTTVVKTDAMGRASATIKKGSFVAVVNPMNYIHVHAAFANPGDTLRFGPDIVARQPNGSVRVTWPARVISGYTTYYYVYTSCGYSGETTGTSVTLPLDTACSTQPFDVVVTSRRSSQGVTGVMSRRGVMATGQLVTVSLADNGGAWQTATTTSVPLTNMPSTTDHTGSCTAVQQLGTLAFNSDGGSASSTACAMRLLPEATSTWAVEASFYKDSNDRSAIQMRQTMPQTSITPIDGANHLPWITTFAYDKATRRVTWSSDADAAFDASALRIDVSGPRYMVWRIVAPNGLPKTFQIPTLPAELAMWDLGPNDDARASLVNMDFVGVSPAEFMAHDLDQEDGFVDKPRRGATARTP